MKKRSLTKKEIAVVIPIYRQELSDTERLSLEQCAAVLSDYDIVFLKPEHLDISPVKRLCPSGREESLADEWFVSRRSYNRLVLEEEFYRRFEKHAYILIYQLDAFVFRDELIDWARQGYDYIGAPWLPRKKRRRTPLGRLCFRAKALYKRIFRPQEFLSPKYYAYCVGNGGLSLRKVSAMIRITSFYREKIHALLSDDREFYAEDIFLLRELNDKNVQLKKPGWKKALRFAMEECPDWAFRYIGNRLPFGCHAFDLKDYAAFWKPFLHLN